MPCGTDRIDCYGCDKHDLKSMYKCMTCAEWFCGDCTFQGLPRNICIGCLGRQVGLRENA